MKKRIVILLLLLSLTLLSLSSCEFKQGYDGLSAYELACKAGFEGTEEEWLASLQGKDGQNGQDGQTTTVITGESALSPQTVAKTLTSTVMISGSAGSGAGVIYRLDKGTGDAVVITNYHVVYNKSTSSIAAAIYAYVFGSEYNDYAIPATFLGGSAYYDVAVLQISGSELLKTGISQTAEIAAPPCYAGETVLAVGNPNADGLSVTAGLVSVASESVELTVSGSQTTEMHRLIRIDAPVSPGNSGGGLYNVKGELVGIVNAKYSSSDVEGIGYAIPAERAVAVAENILRNCNGTDKTEVRRAFLGLTVKMKDSRAVLNADGLLDVVETVEVAEVTADSFAKAEMAAGDLLLAVKVGDRETREITSSYLLIEELLYADAGTTVELTYSRAGETDTAVLVVPQTAIRAY